MKSITLNRDTVVNGERIKKGDTVKTSDAEAYFLITSKIAHTADVAEAADAEIKKPQTRTTKKTPKKAADTAAD